MTRASAAGTREQDARSTSPGGRKRKGLRWLAGITGFFVLLLVLLVLTRNQWLESVARQQIEASTGLRAEIGALSTPLGSGRFEVRDLKLFNTGEFGPSLMAHVPELIVDLDPGEAAQGRLHFQLVKLDMAALNVVRSTGGRLNVEGVEKKLRERIRRKKRKGERFEWEFAGVERLELTLGPVQYTDLKRPALSRTLDLAVKNEVATNWTNEADMQRWMGGLLFRITMQVALTELRPPAVSPPVSRDSGISGATSSNSFPEAGNPPKF